jgi:hypothetical protein
VRYFNRESHEELLWWIQVPALVRATPAEQRATAQQCFAAVGRGSQAAKDAGYRLDVLLAAEARSGRAREMQSTGKSSGPGAGAARKTAKAGATKSSPSSSQVKAKPKPSSPQDGAGGDASAEKASTGKAKKTTKKSSPSKRKP